MPGTDPKKVFNLFVRSSHTLPFTVVSTAIDCLLCRALIQKKLVCLYAALIHFYLLLQLQAMSGWRVCPLTLYIFPRGVIINKFLLQLHRWIFWKCSSLRTHLYYVLWKNICWPWYMHVWKLKGFGKSSGASLYWNKRSNSVVHYSTAINCRL